MWNGRDGRVICTAQDRAKCSVYRIWQLIHKPFPRSCSPLRGTKYFLRETIYSIRRKNICPARHKIYLSVNDELFWRTKRTIWRTTEISFRKRWNPFSRLERSLMVEYRGIIPTTSLVAICFICVTKELAGPWHVLDSCAWCGRFLVLQIGCIIIGNSNLYKDGRTVFNPESVVDTMKKFHNMKMSKMLYI